MGDEDVADGCKPRGMDLGAEAEECFVLRGPRHDRKRDADYSCGSLTPGR